MSSLFTHSMPMLADSTAPQLPSGFNFEVQKAFSGSTVAIFSGLAVLAFGVIWAVFFRKSEKRKGRRVINENKGSGRRRRRRHSKDRPRNPTLSDTGGLPAEGSGNLNPTDL